MIKKDVEELLRIIGVTGLLVERLNIAPTDVFIVINEPPLENWGVGGNWNAGVQYA